MKVKSNCLICSKEFKHPESKKNAKYCSKPCQHYPTKQIRGACIICNKEFKYLLCARVDPKYCSKTCKDIGQKVKPLTEKKGRDGLSKRFEKKIIKHEMACWEWTGAITGKGYGIMGHGRKNNILAHRVSWLLNFGQIPEGMFVCHHCDNPPCTRPDHLFLGNDKINVADMWRKNRQKGQFKKGISYRKLFKMGIKP